MAYQIHFRCSVCGCRETVHEKIDDSIVETCLECGTLLEAFEETTAGAFMDDNYRILEEGEIIKEGDEIDAGLAWNDPVRWVPAGITVGKPAPNPHYPSHRIYRRRILAEGEVRP